MAGMDKRGSCGILSRTKISNVRTLKLVLESLRIKKFNLIFFLDKNWFRSVNQPKIEKPEQNFAQNQGDQMIF